MIRKEELVYNSLNNKENNENLMPHIEGKKMQNSFFVKPNIEMEIIFVSTIYKLLCRVSQKDNILPGGSLFEKRDEQIYASGISTMNYSV